MEKPTRDHLIGRNLVRLRGDRSQTEIADLMRERGFKWSQATVWNVERGERPIRLAEADVLSRLLGVELHDLLKVPDWFPFFDAQVEVERSEERLLAEADRRDYLLGVLARAADALAGEQGAAVVADELLDWRFDESPVDFLSARWQGRRHGKVEGPYTAAYLSRKDLLHEAMGDNGEYPAAP